MKERGALFLLAGALLALVPARGFSGLRSGEPSVEAMSRDFVADFRPGPVAARPFVFGIRVRGA